VKLGTPVLVVSCLALAAAELIPERAPAQVTLTPRVIQIDQLKCSELQSASDQRQERLLVYFNGYMDGMRQHKVWDERKVGELIDRALANCKADPGGTVLAAFTKAAK
jgi:HdeA/HdeB family